METLALRNKYNQLLGQKNKVAQLHDDTEANYKKLKEKYDNALIMQSLIQKAAKNTQEKLKFSIEKIVTSAIESVFEEDGYKFELQFTTKNDSTHCTPLFVDGDGEGYDADADLGGSIGDVGAFACRIALWTLAGENKSTPIFLLDESMKHLSEGYRELGSDLLKSFCDKLDMQIIISTHLKELIGDASNSILVKKEKGVSVAYVETHI